MVTKIKVAMQAKRANEGGWPHINFDYEKLGREVIEVLKAKMPSAKFDLKIYENAVDAEKDYQNDKVYYDGIVLLMSSNWVGVSQVYCRNVSCDFPVVIANIPHAGDGGFLKAMTEIVKRDLPIATVSSLDYQDIAETVQNIEVIKKMKHEKILVISNRLQEQDSRFAAIADAAEKIWGCKFVLESSDPLLEIYESLTDEEAIPLANKWRSNAIRVVEPEQAELIKSAKLYYALEKLKEKEGCSAVTVDCLSLFYSGKMFAYPCLSFFEMGNRGEVGVCEADIDATITSLLALHGCQRPGFVSDPAIDTSCGQIIYDHCVCSNKVFGAKDSRSCEYYIRSHAEDQKGASVQAILPLGKALTTIKVSSCAKAFSVHKSKSVGNVGYDRGCRTKMAAEANVEAILQNWDSRIFEWHRVTIFGDYYKKFMDIARLKGLKCIREDQ